MSKEELTLTQQLEALKEQADAIKTIPCQPNCEQGDWNRYQLQFDKLMDTVLGILPKRDNKWDLGNSELITKILVNFKPSESPKKVCPIYPGVKVDFNTEFCYSEDMHPEVLKRIRRLGLATHLQTLILRPVSFDREFRRNMELIGFTF